MNPGYTFERDRGMPVLLAVVEWSAARVSAPHLPVSVAQPKPEPTAQLSRSWFTMYHPAPAPPPCQMEISTRSVACAVDTSQCRVSVKQTWMTWG